LKLAHTTDRFAPRGSQSQLQWPSPNQTRA